MFLSFSNVIFSGGFEDCLNLRLCNHWECPGVKKKQYKEETDGTDEDSDIDKCWREHRPWRRKIIPVQRSHDNYETLKPHTDVYYNRDDKGEHDTGP